MTLENCFFWERLVRDRTPFTISLVLPEKFESSVYFNANDCRRQTLDYSGEFINELTIGNNRP